MHNAMINCFDGFEGRAGTNSTKWEAVRGTDILPLWVADMDLPVMPEIAQAVQARAEHPLYGYTAAPDAFYESFTGWNLRRFGTRIQRAWLLRSCGVISTMKAAILAFTNPGDRVLLQPPVYPPFAGAVRITGRALVESPLLCGADGRYAIDFDDLDRKLAGTKLFLLCNPHNPVGRVFTRAELTRIVLLCEKHGTLIFADEAHCDIVYPGHEHTPLLSLGGYAQTHTITAMGPGKTFNIAGLKTSFSIVPDDTLRERLFAMMDIFGVASTNTFGYAASCAAYTHGEAWLAQLLSYLHENARYATGFLKENLPAVRVVMPEGTFLLWLDFRALGLSDAALYERLKADARVLLNEGPSFGAGGSGFARMNIACPRGLLEEGLLRIQQAFSSFC